MFTVRSARSNRLYQPSRRRGFLVFLIFALISGLGVGGWMLWNYSYPDHLSRWVPADAAFYTHWRIGSSEEAEFPSWWLGLGFQDVGYDSSTTRTFFHLFMTPGSEGGLARSSPETSDWMLMLYRPEPRLFDTLFIEVGGGSGLVPGEIIPLKSAAFSTSPANVPLFMTFVSDEVALLSPSQTMLERAVTQPEKTHSFFSRLSQAIRKHSFYAVYPPSDGPGSFQKPLLFREKHPDARPWYFVADKRENAWKWQTMVKPPPLWASWLESKQENMPSLALPDVHLVFHQAFSSFPDSANMVSAQAVWKIVTEISGTGTVIGTIINEQPALLYSEALSGASTDRLSVFRSAVERYLSHKYPSAQPRNLSDGTLIHELIPTANLGLETVQEQGFSGWRLFVPGQTETWWLGQGPTSLILTDSEALKEMYRKQAASGSAGFSPVPSPCRPRFAEWWYVDRSFWLEMSSTDWSHFLAWQDQDGESQGCLW